MLADGNFDEDNDAAKAGNDAKCKENVKGNPSLFLENHEKKTTNDNHNSNTIFSSTQRLAAPQCVSSIPLNNLKSYSYYYLWLPLLLQLLYPWSRNR